MKRILNTETTITFLRHGVVENPQEILYGRLPGFGLSVLGKKQIIATGQELAKMNVSQIYTSPMKRTRETSTILGKILARVPKVSFLLNEVCLFCQGITTREYHVRVQQNLYSEKNYNKGQERIEHIFLRMKQFVKLIVKKHPGVHVVAVSHGDPIMILRALSSGIEFSWDYKRRNYLQTGKYITLRVKSDGKYVWNP